MIVEECQIGNTKIKICDDACVKTQEEIDRILARVSEVIRKALSDS